MSRCIYTSLNPPTLPLFLPELAGNKLIHTLCLPHTHNKCVQNMFRTPGSRFPTVRKIALNIDE